MASPNHSMFLAPPAVEDEAGNMKLRMPTRFGTGTVKAAAWTVLSQAGPEGLNINEIAKRIQKNGLRDLRTSKTPEASVAGALSRDVIFVRVAPATYALQAVITKARKAGQGQAQAGTDAVAAPAAQDGQAAAGEGKMDVDAAPAKTEPAGDVEMTGPEQAQPAAPAEVKVEAQAATDGAAPMDVDSTAQPQQQAQAAAPAGDSGVKQEQGAAGADQQQQQAQAQQHPEEEEYSDEEEEEEDPKQVCRKTVQAWYLQS